MATYTPKQAQAAKTRMESLCAALKDVSSPYQQQRVTEMQAALDAGKSGITAYMDAHPAFADLS